MTPTVDAAMDYVPPAVALDDVARHEIGRRLRSLEALARQLAVERNDALSQLAAEQQECKGRVAAWCAERADLAHERDVATAAAVGSALVRDEEVRRRRSAELSLRTLQAAKNRSEIQRVRNEQALRASQTVCERAVNEASALQNERLEAASRAGAEIRRATDMLAVAERDMQDLLRDGRADRRKSAALRITVAVLVACVRRRRVPLPSPADAPAATSQRANNVTCEWSERDEWAERDECSATRERDEAHRSCHHTWPAYISPAIDVHISNLYGALSHVVHAARTDTVMPLHWASAPSLAPHFLPTTPAQVQNHKWQSWSPTPTMPPLPPCAPWSLHLN